MTNRSLNIDERIKILLYKIKNSTVTKIERKEYIDLLFEGNYIDLMEYNKYITEFNRDKLNIGETLVGIGLAVLVGALIAELFKK